MQDTIKWADWMRSDPDEVGMQWLEFSDRHERKRQAGIIQSYAGKSGAKIRFRSLNAFDVQQNPTFLLNVELIQQGRPLESRGRPAHDVEYPDL